jgi:hypothetical protein
MHCWLCIALCQHSSALAVRVNQHCRLYVTYLVWNAWIALYYCHLLIDELEQVFCDRFCYSRNLFVAQGLHSKASCWLLSLLQAMHCPRIACLSSASCAIILQSARSGLLNSSAAKKRHNVGLSYAFEPRTVRMCWRLLGLLYSCALLSCLQALAAADQEHRVR